jgi:hypothetical protein
MRTVCVCACHIRHWLAACCEKGNHIYTQAHTCMYMDYLYDSRVQNHDFSSRVNCENVLFTKKIVFFIKYVYLLDMHIAQ